MGAPEKQQGGVLNEKTILLNLAGPMKNHQQGVKFLSFSTGK
jgi:hypothetical protein